MCVPIHFKDSLLSFLSLRCCIYHCKAFQKSFLAQFPELLVPKNRAQCFNFIIMLWCCAKNRKQSIATKTVWTGFGTSLSTSIRSKTHPMNPGQILCEVESLREADIFLSPAPPFLIVFPISKISGMTKKAALQRPLSHYQKMLTTKDLRQSVLAHSRVTLTVAKRYRSALKKWSKHTPDCQNDLMKCDAEYSQARKRSRSWTSRSLLKNHFNCDGLDF